MSTQALVHRALIWAPPALGGAVIGVAGVWDQARDWIALQAASAWSNLNPLSAVLIIGLALAYIATCVWTSPEASKNRKLTKLGDPLKVSYEPTTFRNYEFNVIVNTQLTISNAGDDQLSVSVSHAYLTRDDEGKEVVELCEDNDGAYLRRFYPEHLIEFLAPRLLDNPQSIPGRSSVRGSIVTVAKQTSMNLFFANRGVALVVEDHTRSRRFMLVPGEAKPRRLDADI